MPWNIFDICENIGSSTVQLSWNTILLLPRVRKWYTEDKIQWKFGALWGGKGHFPCGTSNKELPTNGDVGLISRLGRSPGGGHDYPLQYSCLENPVRREALWATVHRVTHIWTRLKQLSMHGGERSHWFVEIKKVFFCLWGRLWRKRRVIVVCQGGRKTGK